MTDTPALHTLAAEALYAAPDEECGTWHGIVRVVLAAVLPAHRRQVLAEAEAALRDEDGYRRWAMGQVHVDGRQPLAVVGEGDLFAEYLAERLASAAPETAPRPRQNDETAPAVPETTPAPSVEVIPEYEGDDAAAPDVCDSKAPSLLLPSEPDRYCTLPLGHRGWHREGAMQWRGGVALDGPRTWQLPDEPGPEVTAVRDRHERVWKRHSDGIWCYVTDDLKHAHWLWSRLIVVCGPLTDATSADGQDGDGHG